MPPLSLPTGTSIGGSWSAALSSEPARASRSAIIFPSSTASTAASCPSGSALVHEAFGDIELVRALVEDFRLRRANGADERLNAELRIRGDQLSAKGIGTCCCLNRSGQRCGLRRLGRRRSAERVGRNQRSLRLLGYAAADREEHNWENTQDRSQHSATPVFPFSGGSKIRADLRSAAKRGLVRTNGAGGVPSQGTFV